METVYLDDLAVCPEDAHFVCEKHTPNEEVTMSILVLVYFTCMFSFSAV